MRHHSCVIGVSTLAGTAVFVREGTYYLWTSGTMGWEPTTMYLYTADGPLGAFANSSEGGHGWHSYVTCGKGKHENGGWAMSFISLDRFPY